ncbi:TPA_asm: P [Ficus alphacytorhabdovirus 1]|nr:TPA_asm: P [Ficus alphacytorhabdovirus 1]
MADIDYSSLPDPKLDIKMSLDDEEVDDLSDGYGEAGDEELNSILQDDIVGDSQVDKEPYVGGDDDYLPYDPADVNDALDDAKALCDQEGVAYTIPMENQIKAGISSGTMSYICIVWYIKGVATANQTQILPSVTSAVGELKMETRHLQKAANKLNNESSKVEKVTSSFLAEIKAISAEVAASFRDNMRALVEEIGINKMEEPNKQKTMGERIGSRVSESTGSVIAEADRVEQIIEDNKSKSTILHDEKRQCMRTMGFLPSLIKTLNEETIDIIYPDQLHHLFTTSKSQKKIKLAVKKTIEDNIQDILSESDIDDDA